jgi:hypothetical protein
MVDEKKENAGPEQEENVLRERVRGLSVSERVYDGRGD